MERTFCSWTKQPKAIVWIAAGVVIVAGGIFISNDQASKRASKERECADDFFVSGGLRHERDAEQAMQNSYLPMR